MGLAISLIIELGILLEGAIATAVAGGTAAAATLAAEEAGIASGLFSLTVLEGFTEAEAVAILGVTTGVEATSTTLGTAVVTGVISTASAGSLAASLLNKQVGGAEHYWDRATENYIEPPDMSQTVMPTWMHYVMNEDTFAAIAYTGQAAFQWYNAATGVRQQFMQLRNMYERGEVTPEALYQFGSQLFRTYERLPPISSRLPIFVGKTFYVPKGYEFSNKKEDIKEWFEEQTPETTDIKTSGINYAALSALGEIMGPNSDPSVTPLVAYAISAAAAARPTVTRKRKDGGKETTGRKRRRP